MVFLRFALAVLVVVTHGHLRRSSDESNNKSLEYSNNNDDTTSTYKNNSNNVLHDVSNVTNQASDPSDWKTSFRRTKDGIMENEERRLDTCKHELVKCGCNTSILDHDFGGGGKAGVGVDATELEINQAGRVIPGLHRLEKTSGVAALSPVRIAEFSKNAPVDDVANLTSLLNKHHSDKAANGYAPVYVEIFNRLDRNAELSILEVGMGTNDTKITSTMGKGGTPGASLRSWQDYLPKAHIFGADFDPKIMMNENRIVTHVVDSLDYASYETMHNDFGKRSFDVIIDDAMHSNVGNLNTIAFGLNGACKSNGWIVIEDIGTGGRVDFFSIVKTMLQPRNIQTITVAVRDGLLEEKKGQLYMFLVKCP